MFTFFKSKHNQFVTILSTFFSDFREFFYVKRVQFNKNSSKLIVKPASQQSIRWLLKVYMENFKGAAITDVPIASQKLHTTYLPTTISYNFNCAKLRGPREAWNTCFCDQ